MRLIAPNQQRRDTTPSTSGATPSPNKRGLTNLQPTSDSAKPLGNQLAPITPPNPALAAGSGSNAARTGQALTAPTAPTVPEAPRVPFERASAPSLRDDRVSSRAAEIARSGSPLMRWAETAGKQYANERGLLNSSLAAGAVGTSVLTQAADLARADVAAQQSAESLAETQRQFDNAHGMNLAQLLLQHGTAVAGLELDTNRLRLEFEKAADDIEFREKQFAAGERHAAFGRDLEARKFASSEARRVWVEQMERRQIALHEQAQAFQQNLDMERFESDQDYRDRALEQAKSLQTQQLAIDVERLGLAQTQQAVDVQVKSAEIRQSAALGLFNEIKAIGEMEGLSDAEKKTLTDKAIDRHNALDTTATALSNQKLLLGDDDEQGDNPDPAPPPALPDEPKGTPSQTRNTGSTRNTGAQARGAPARGSRLSNPRTSPTTARGTSGLTSQSRFRGGPGTGFR